MRNKASLFFGIMLLAWVMVGCDEVKLGVTYVRGFISGYVHSAFVEDLDEKRIPQVPVEYAGEVGVDLKRTVELVFDDETPGIGRIEWMGITPDNALLLTDQVSGEAHEFSLNDGRHIRSFGRRGKGPGEYGQCPGRWLWTPRVIFISRIKRTGQLLHYNRQGQYLDDKMRWIANADLLVDRDDALLLLEKNYGGLLQIRKIRGLNGKVEYTLPLFRRKDRFISSYSCPLRLWYATMPRWITCIIWRPITTMVKEIDAAERAKYCDNLVLLCRAMTSLLLRSSHHQTLDFYQKKYHNLSPGSDPNGKPWQL